MKHLEVIFSNGHFYEKTSKSRIHLNNDVDLQIIIDEAYLRDEDPLNKPWLPEEIISSEKMKGLVAAKAMKLKNRFVKVAAAGQRFVFKTTLTKRDNTPKVFVFSFQILEDLFAIQSGGTNKPWSLYPCKCAMDKCLTNNIEFFEVIHAASISNVVIKTNTHFFPNNPTPVKNAHDYVFYWDGQRSLDPEVIKNSKNGMHNIKKEIEKIVGQLNELVKKYSQKDKELEEIPCINDHIKYIQTKYARIEEAKNKMREAKEKLKMLKSKLDRNSFS
jgi:hypothetical protein